MEGLFKTLGHVTGRHRSASEAAALLGGSYVLTTDNLLKMLAVR